MPTDDDLLALFPPGSARDADGGLRVAGCRLDGSPRCTARR